jgi:hypothetical protein
LQHDQHPVRRPRALARSTLFRLAGMPPRCLED